MSLQMNNNLITDTVVEILEMANLPPSQLDSFSLDSKDLTISMKELLKLYTKLIQIPSSNHNAMRRKLLYHLSFFKLQLLQFMTLDSFYKLIEGLLGFYCRLELEITSIDCERQEENTDNTEEWICRTSDRILTVLKTYLKNSEKHIFKLLLHVSRQNRNEYGCAVLRILYCQVLNIYPLHYLYTEALCRKYIILMKVIEHNTENFAANDQKMLTKCQFYTDHIMDLTFSVNNGKSLKFQNNVFSLVSTIQSLVHKESSSDNVICDVDVSPIDDVDDLPEKPITENVMSTDELVNLLDCGNQKSESIDKLLAMKAIRRKPNLLLKKIDPIVMNHLDNSTTTAKDKTRKVHFKIPTQLDIAINDHEKYKKQSNKKVQTPEKSNENSENLTIESILKDEDILSQCYDKNEAIIESLRNVQILKKLFLIVLSNKEPLDLFDTNKAYLILCAIVPLIRVFIVCKCELIQFLINFITQKTPLDPMLASRYSKIMTLLVVRSDDEDWYTYRRECNLVLDYIQCRKMINGLLFHVETAAIRDLLMVLMTQVYLKQRIIIFLNDHDLIQSLIKMLISKLGPARNDSVAQLLHEFGQIANRNRRTQQKRHRTDVLLSTLEQPSTIRLLLNTIFTKHRSESSLVGGMKVLIGLLKYEKSTISKYYYPKSYNTTESQMLPALKYLELRWIESTAHIVTERLSDFHEVLMHPPKKASIETTVGLLKVPMGNTRIQVVTLLAVLIKIGNNDTVTKLVSLGTMKVMLDLFFSYPLNNLYHIQVYACILASFQTYDSCTPNKTSLAMHLLVDCQLVEKINKFLLHIDPKSTKSRPGFLGWLVKIANVVADYCEMRNPLGKELRKKAPKSFKLLQQLKAGRLRDIVLIFMYPLMGDEFDDSHSD
ncbi:PREDICTED: serine/threonine-protein phosphatase 6 regulatory subunit 3-like [Nicrophorus vespilloides]|uniref:Serine/threonine-protein phosphatase 6 regulatory subunit 3-like n=1 Tax=Nicrophorus vespilloides TaxID=110193 RepID=A0ABM1MGF5_NICVS|nr:PREDICTED: serine/threonine-protein phosphatase 6 regulatory subunit 3-like [Nicrophorus vespilloides]